MDIHQARGHIETSDIDHLRTRRNFNVLGDLSNLVIFDGHVANAVDPVFRVDDVTALEYKVIRGLTMNQRGRQKADQQENRQPT